MGEPIGYLYYSPNFSLKQVFKAFAPRERYQVVEAILKGGGAYSIKSLWTNLKLANTICLVISGRHVIATQGLDPKERG